MVLINWEAGAATPSRPRSLASVAAAAATKATTTLPASSAIHISSSKLRCGRRGEDDPPRAKASNNSQLKSLAADMHRPATCAIALHSFHQLRTLLPRRFVELCKVHLSFLIDVPADFLEGVDDNNNNGSNSCGNPTNNGYTSASWLRQHVRSSIKLRRTQPTPANCDPGSRAGSSAGFDRVNSTAAVESVPASATASSSSSSSRSSTELASLDTLLTRLSPHAATVEGLFRKCGSAARQRRLVDALTAPSTGPDSELQAAADGGAFDGCSPHDLAGALKACLAGLSEPLLTRRLLPYFHQVAHLCSQGDDAAGDRDRVGEVDEARLAVLTARRLKAMRLLVQLLPPRRRDLLGRLLALLAKTGGVADGDDGKLSVSRMTPESLGTVFGPALLYPDGEDDVIIDGENDAAADAVGQRRRRGLRGAAGYGETQRRAAKLNSTVAFAIRHADGVMQVPDSIAQDAVRILRQHGDSQRPSIASDVVEAADEVEHDDGDDEAAALRLSVRFAQSADGDGDGDGETDAKADAFTRAQVAALFAAVRAMPDSAKRRRLIRRFNRTNGGLPTMGTPVAVSPSPSPSNLATSNLSPSPPISSPVFGRLLDFPTRCLSPQPEP